MTVHGDPDLNVLERTWSEDLDIRLTDTCLRDGSHHKRHQFTAEEVRSVIAALDDAGVPVLEVTHGDGLGGSSFNYGFSHTPEQELIKIAAETAKQARIAFLMLPGVGTKDDILEAQDNGGSICRIATHCTEADTSEQHFALARERRARDGRLPDDEPHAAAGGAGEAGPDHGRRRLPVRLCRRLGGRADHGGRGGPRLRARGGDRQRGDGRVPRPREPRPRRSQHGDGGARRARPRSTAPYAGSAPERATPHWTPSSASATSSAGGPVWTS